jgi:hypothetical protein
MGSGNNFANQDAPQIVVQVGSNGVSDPTEFGGIIFSTRGPTPGAIVVEWDVRPKAQGGAGMWDSFVRLGGTAGTNMQSSQCPTMSPGSSCYAAFLAVHLTSASSAYFEV